MGFAILAYSRTPEKHGKLAQLTTLAAFPDIAGSPYHA
jgi:hypothetical protein